MSDDIEPGYLLGYAEGYNDGKAGRQFGEGRSGRRLADRWPTIAAVLDAAEALTRTSGSGDWGDAWEDLEDAVRVYREASAPSSPDTPRSTVMDAETLARLFHETYEELAPSHGWETQERSRKVWEEVPAENKSLMIAVAERVLDALSPSSPDTRGAQT